jgi:2-polyprenyl-6-methoxyphenol hydroxylase-like FAD-dependent oxidoreductase
MSDSPTVLVVGAGPAGLSTAITLAQYGISTLVVDRRAGPSGLPRATSVSTRTMELIRSWGLEARVRAAGVDVEWRRWTGRRLVGPGEVAPISFPSREQSEIVSPTGPASVPQDALEPILLEHLRGLPAARVEFGRELTGLRPDAGGVRAVMQGSNGSTAVQARYLVAADGAHSRARRLLGIPMTGPGRSSSAIATLFRAPLWEHLADRRYQLYSVTEPTAAGVFLPAGPGDRWTYGVEFEHGRAPLDRFTPDHVVRRLRAATGIPGLQPRLEGIGAFAFAAGIAERFREGDAFLVGDAAHRVTPRGGTGLNTAVQGGHHLGWKLAWVLRGWAGPALLDSYEREFRPVAAHQVSRSVDPDGGLRPAAEELPADLGPRLPHRWLPGPARTSTLDLVGPGLTLLVGPAGAAWAPAAESVGIPTGSHRLDETTARSLGLGPTGALLVRPDGAPVGWWPCDRGAEHVLPAAVTSLTRSNPELTDPAAVSAAAALASSVPAGPSLPSQPSLASVPEGGPRGGSRPPPGCSPGEPRRPRR